MSPPIRVLLADDSVAVRRLLAETLSSDPELEVCCAARDGQEAVTQFSQLQPDVVLLDLEMPVMDGIEAVVAIRKLNARVPLIMFSAYTREASEATIDALSSGATDFVTKPKMVGHVQNAVTHIREHLVTKIKVWGRWYREQRTNPAAPVPTIALARAPLGVRPEPSPPRAASASAKRATAPEVVAIGVSTGGPNALAEVLKRLPPVFPLPILIAQHMPVMFTKLLADRLDQVCPFHVREAVDGTPLEPGQVWIAPGDTHLVVEKQGFRKVLKLNHGPHENSCRPSADVLFRSVAAAYGESAIAVVMTGMGQDGKVGCQHIRYRGGTVLAQDQATSVVWGMPKAVIEAGLANRVVPLPAIAEELCRLSMCRSSPVAAS